MFFWFFLYLFLKQYFCFEQVSKTGNLDASLIVRQHKVDIMSGFMEIESNNPKLTQKQAAKNKVFLIVYLNKVKMI